MFCPLGVLGGEAVTGEAWPKGIDCPEGWPRGLKQEVRSVATGTMTESTKTPLE